MIHDGGSSRSDRIPDNVAPLRGQAVEAGQVPADLLTDLQAEIGAARDWPEDQSHAGTVRDFADRLCILVAEAGRTLASLEELPTVTREAAPRCPGCKFREAT